jgi:phosphoribosyl-dephospho-CoA transferase
MNIPPLLKKLSAAFVVVAVICVFLVDRMRVPKAMPVEGGGGIRVAPVTARQSVVAPALPANNVPKTSATDVTEEIMAQVKARTVKEIKAWETASRLQAFNESDQEMTITIMAMPENRLKEIKAKIESEYPLAENQYRAAWKSRKIQQLMEDLSWKRIFRLKLKGANGQEYDTLVVEKRLIDQHGKNSTFKGVTGSNTKYSMPDGKIPVQFAHILQIQSDP